MIRIEDLPQELGALQMVARGSGLYTYSGWSVGVSQTSQPCLIACSFGVVMNGEIPATEMPTTSYALEASSVPEASAPVTIDVQLL